MTAMPRKWFRPLIVIAAAVCVLLVLALCIPDKREFFIHLVLVLLGGLIALCVHELGHTVCGFAAGLRFKEFTVAFLTIDTDGEKLRVRENTSWANVGGLVLFIPATDNVQEMTSKWQLLAAGGPLFSILFGSAAMLLADLSTYPGYLMQAAGFISLAVFLLSVVPHFPGCGYSDGAVVWLLHRGGRRAERYLCSVLLLPWLYGAATPARWPTRLIRQAEQLIAPANHPLQSLAECMEEAGLRVLLYYYNMAAGKRERAAELLRPIVVYRRKAAPAAPALEGIDSLYATHQVLWGGAASAAELQTIAGRISRREPMYPRFQAAWLTWQRNWPEARMALAEAEEIYDRLLKPFGYSVVEHEFLEEIRRRIQHSSREFDRTPTGQQA
ncbi:hypothetical protein [Paenibacillus xerothermodurans]|uniref:M50 family peptidase n=1 Tax=Paenibacillus xerothermodurans TaxID=1977292 RepID=A0A2W1N5R2_PAEXE|nr:hypothetical protein [Paenibacillus xerothermodurans]PZE20039.1 hypothetical protein CBW46_015270 [Paenibacillus xerothermodurans]